MIRHDQDTNIKANKDLPVIVTIKSNYQYVFTNNVTLSNWAINCYNII